MPYDPDPSPWQLWAPEWIDARDSARVGASAETVYLASIEPAASYTVAEINGSHVIQLSDQTIINPEAVRRFILTTPKGITMSEDFDHTDALRYEQVTQNDILTNDEADALLASVDPTRHGYIVRIARNAKTARERREIGRVWAALDRACNVGTVTLDTDPERRGRPVPLRPSTPQIKLIEVPEWHHDYLIGRERFLVVYYVPVTTWIARDGIVDPLSGEIETITTVKAAMHDPAGYTHLVRIVEFASDDERETWLASLKRAVDTLAGRFEEDDPDEIEARQLAREDDVKERMRRLLKS